MINYSKVKISNGPCGRYLSQNKKLNKDYIETIGEDAYDDWDNHVWNSIKDTEEYKKFNELMLSVINSHKVYYPGQIVYIDYKGE